MINTNRSLAYSAVVVGALSLAGCSQSAGTHQAAADAQHRYNVYFDVAKSDLTPEAQQVIAQAVTVANRNASARILVLAPEADAGAKARRADAVQAALVASGVAPDRIDARWIGAQGSPVGVRDPRNRVVEISFESDRSGNSEVAKLLVSRRIGD